MSCSVITSSPVKSALEAKAKELKDKERRIKLKTEASNERRLQKQKDMDKKERTRRSLKRRLVGHAVVQMPRNHARPLQNRGRVLPAMWFTKNRHPRTGLRAPNAASGGTSHAVIMRAPENIHVIIVDSIQMLRR